MAFKALGLFIVNTMTCLAGNDTLSSSECFGGSSGTSDMSRGSRHAPGVNGRKRIITQTMFTEKNFDAFGPIRDTRQLEHQYINVKGDPFENPDNLLML